MSEPGGANLKADGSLSDWCCLNIKGEGTCRVVHSDYTTTDDTARRDPCPP